MTVHASQRSCVRTLQHIISYWRGGGYRLLRASTAAAAATATELPMCEYSAIEFTLSPALFTNLYVACVFRDVFELFGSINLLERLRLDLYYNVVILCHVHQRHRCRAIEINLSLNVQSLNLTKHVVGVIIKTTFYTK